MPLGLGKGDEYTDTDFTRQWSELLKGDDIDTEYRSGSVRESTSSTIVANWTS